MALLGSPHGSVTIKNLFEQVDHKDLTILGCHQPNNPTASVPGAQWSQRRERKLILNLLAAGKLDPSKLPVKRCKPDDVPDIYSALNDPDQKTLTGLIGWKA